MNFIRPKRDSLIKYAQTFKVEHEMSARKIMASLDVPNKKYGILVSNIGVLQNGIVDLESRGQEQHVNILGLQKIINLVILHDHLAVYASV